MLLDNGVRYTNAPGGWGELMSQGGSGLASRFYATDLSGNTRALADPTGAVTDSFAYSAFGEEIAASGSTNPPFRFGGEWGYYRDDPERLYVRARHLDVASGRWLSRDPVGFAGGLNLYGYVGNDPVNGIDPSGHDNKRGGLGLVIFGPIGSYFLTGKWNPSSNELSDGLRDTGPYVSSSSYWDSVGHVIQGYGDALNLVKAAQNLGQLAGYADVHGKWAAAKHAAEGTWHGLTAWTQTSDPREFGQSFLTFELTVAPGLKRIPSSALPRVAIIGRLGSVADASAVARIANTTGTITGIGNRVTIFIADRRILAALQRTHGLQGPIRPGEVPRFYGTRMHTQLEAQIKGLNKSHIRAEVSYLDEREVARFTRGSARPDIVILSKSGKVIAIYDLKTGARGLTARQIEHDRNNVPIGSSGIVIKEIR